ncbi:IclR family transcriptional regulator [Planosporangium flavigriseum]|uniref:Transcriptional regulator n=1 Tax=Planosporangium flavigriseum TaxID=373681 RepID=A0A8J3LHZ6_9ACTN|nr:IclR family transcriptional regulator [Planosporangium flavigriseum]NJC65025.1 IclR family transcriptional regulator [Planosporangium flavigriseum]GIG71639.1 transcriptional regulator [Planosporangium flavigriseum]
MPARGSCPYPAGPAGTAGSAEPTGLLRSVDRAVRVLDHVADAPGPLAAKDIARDLDLTLPTTYHLLTTLVRAGYLVHLTAAHAYALGHRLDDLARALRRQLAVPAEVERIAAICHEEARAAAYYTALRDGEMVVAYVADCPDHPRMRLLDVGFHHAPHATAFGKLMLAALDPAARDELLARTGTRAVTPWTVTDPHALRRQLDQVRATGLAIETDEVQSELGGMAAPVTDATGRLVGAVAVSMPTGQLLRRRREVERAVRTAAVRASRAACAAAVRAGAA